MRQILSLIGAAILTLSLIGCQGNSHKSNGGTKTKSATVTMDLGLSALYLGSNDRAGSLIKDTAAADTVMTGQLIAYDLDHNTSQNYSWSASLDTETLEMVSNKTNVLDALEGGTTYRFSMTLSNGNRQYMHGPDSCITFS